MGANYVGMGGSDAPNYGLGAQVLFPSNYMYIFNNKKLDYK